MVNPVLENPISGYHHHDRMRLTRGPKMKLLKGDLENVVDVPAKRSVGEKRRLWAMALVLSLLAAGSILLGYVQFWKPYQYKRTAEFVIRDVLKESWRPIAGSGPASLADLQPIEQSLELANLLAKNKEFGLNSAKRFELAHELFQYSIFFGNPFARID